MDTFEMMSEIEEYKKFLDSNEDIESLFRIRSTKDEGVVGYFIHDNVALKFDELDKKIKDLPYSLDEHIEGFSARWSKLKCRLEEKIRKESETDEAMSKIQKGLDKILEKREELVQKYKTFLDKIDGGVSVLTCLAEFEDLDSYLVGPINMDKYIVDFTARWSQLKEFIGKENETDEAMSKIQKGFDEILEKRKELVQKYKTFLDKIDGGVSVLTCLEEFEDLDCSLKSINMDEYINDFTARWSQLKEFIRKELVKEEIKRQKRKETTGNVIGISILVIIALAIVGGAIALCIFDPLGIHFVLGTIITFAMMFIWLVIFFALDKRNLVPWFIIITAILGMSAVGLLFVSNEVGVVYCSAIMTGNLLSTISVAGLSSDEDGECVRTPGQHKLNRAVAIITGIVVTIFSLIIFYILVPQAIHWAIALVACAIYVTIWTVIGVKAKGNFLPAYITVSTLIGLGTIGLFFIPQVGFIYGIGTLSGIAISLVISIIISIVRRNKAKHK